MKVKRRDLITIWAVLDSLKGTKTNIRTTYTIARNRNLIQSEIEAIQEATKLSGSLLEYETKRIDLCQKWCEKDGSGQSIIDSGNFVFTIDNRKKFEGELIELQNLVPEMVELKKTQDQQIEALLEGEVSIDLVQFDLSALPDDLMSVIQVEALDKCGLIKI